MATRNARLRRTGVVTTAKQLNKKLAKQRAVSHRYGKVVRRTPPGRVPSPEEVAPPAESMRDERPGQKVRRLRSRRDLLELEIRREVKRYRDDGLSERKIAALVEVSQPTIHKMLEVADRDPVPLEGFKGATPLEICQRFDAGELGREELVDQLVRFPYAKGGKTDGYDSLIVDPPGTWSEVSQAVDRGFIDEDVYEDVFNRRHGL
ncbi:hypothetical protein [Brachybacterium paraconglomeratum]|uniref:hypothetical protein n=1 Tax=Brachybacterium paraconglomeratum TaxID=173362 RepID=UPI0022E156BB|nr:hypothetical protein [Brachybacterium paraconglomeratum]